MRVVDVDCMEAAADVDFASILIKRPAAEDFILTSSRNHRLPNRRNSSLAGSLPEGGYII